MICFLFLFTKTQKRVAQLVQIHDYLYRNNFKIPHTLNLSTDADHRTDNFFWGGDGKNKKNKTKITCDT